MKGFGLRFGVFRTLASLALLAVGLVSGCDCHSGSRPDPNAPDGTSQSPAPATVTQKAGVGHDTGASGGAAETDSGDEGDESGDTASSTGTVESAPQEFDEKDLRRAQAGKDTDEDGINDSDDNCPSDANPDQSNRDDDRWGDVCDRCPARAAPSATYTLHGCPDVEAARNARRDAATDAPN